MSDEHSLVRELLGCDETTHIVKENRILRDINTTLFERDYYKRMYEKVKKSYDELKENLDELLNGEELITLKQYNMNKRLIELEQSAWNEHKYKSMVDLIKLLSDEEQEEYEELFMELYAI